MSENEEWFQNRDFLNCIHHQLHAFTEFLKMIRIAEYNLD